MLATAAQAAPVRWSDPGADRYTGTTEAALKRYAGIIPVDDLAEISAAIKAPASARRWSDLAKITPMRITGAQTYRASITHMMFGRDRMAPEVDLASLPAGTELGARVYCGAGPLCLAIVSVCGNPAVIERIVSATEPRPPPQVAGMIADDPEPAWIAPQATPEPPQDRLFQSASPAGIVQQPQTFERGSGPAIQYTAPPIYSAPAIYIQAPPMPPVSEPRTIALWFAGLGMLAFIIRRRAPIIGA